MKVDWQYDILFSFLVEHPRTTDAFQVRPAPACQQALKKAGLLFKAFPNGGLVAAEKRHLPNGTTRVAHRIAGLTRFSFLLLLRDRSLLADTVPFNAADLPDFSGRRRVLYLDNLSADRRIDTGLEALPPTTPGAAPVMSMPLSTGDWVDRADLASITPRHFDLLLKEGESQLKIESLAPAGAPSQTHTVSPSNRALSLLLPTGGVRAQRQSGATTTTEIWVADDALTTENALGVIDIYKDERVDYNKHIRYDIIF